MLRDLCQQGNKLIFATTFGYMNAVMKVAKEFPDVKFEHATGYQTAANVNNYTARFYEARYMAGILAGKQTKTNILGYVAALPIPEVLQGINAFTLGARASTRTSKSASSGPPPGTTRRRKATPRRASSASAAT